MKRIGFLRFGLQDFSTVSRSFKLEAPYETSSGALTEGKAHKLNTNLFCKHFLTTYSISPVVFAAENFLMSLTKAAAVFIWGFVFQSTVTR